MVRGGFLRRATEANGNEKSPTAAKRGNRGLFVFREFGQTVTSVSTMLWSVTLSFWVFIVRVLATVIFPK